LDAQTSEETTITSEEVTEEVEVDVEILVIILSELEEVDI